MPYLIAFAFFWLVLAVALRRYAVPTWVAAAVGCSGAAVIASAFALIRP